MSVLCAYPPCGKPIPGVAANSPEDRFYHGDCYLLAYPPARLEEATGYGPQTTVIVGPYVNIGQTSHDDRVQDGVELP